MHGYFFFSPVSWRSAAWISIGEGLREASRAGWRIRVPLHASRPTAVAPRSGTGSCRDGSSSLRSGTGSQPRDGGHPSLEPLSLSRSRHPLAHLSVLTTSSSLWMSQWDGEGPYSYCSPIAHYWSPARWNLSNVRLKEQRNLPHVQSHVSV